MAEWGANLRVRTLRMTCRSTWKFSCSRPRLKWEVEDCVGATTSNPIAYRWRWAAFDPLQPFEVSTKPMPIQPSALLEIAGLQVSQISLRN